MGRSVGEQAHLSVRPVVRLAGDDVLRTLEAQPTGEFRTMRTRTFLAVCSAATLLAACAGGSGDVEGDASGDAAATETADADPHDADGAGGTATEADLTDLQPTTTESPTLDGRTLTVTAPGNVVASEPASRGLRFATATSGLTVTTTDAGPGDTPGGEEAELVEDRWDGEIRVVSTPEGVPVAMYDDGETRLLLTADDGPSLEPVTSTDEFLEALDRIDIERTESGPVVTADDPAFERGLSVTYDLVGIDAELRIVDDPELSLLLPVEPVEEPITGASGEVVVGDTSVEQGVIELTGDEVVARIQLTLADDAEQQRALDLMTLLELELQG
jgi:hypothetical protein